MIAAANEKVKGKGAAVRTLQVMPPASRTVFRDGGRRLGAGAGRPSVQSAGWLGQRRFWLAANGHSALVDLARSMSAGDPADAAGTLSKASRQSGSLSQAPLASISRTSAARAVAARSSRPWSMTCALIPPLCGARLPGASA